MSSTTIEIIRPLPASLDLKVAIFDFDGTLSLVRGGWQSMMIPMMIDRLAETGSGETRGQLEAIISEYVARLTGKQTIYQMLRLAEEIEKRGGVALDPLQYKHEYHTQLDRQVKVRVEGLRTGEVTRESLTIFGSHRLLERISKKKLTLYLVSGTDEPYVINEAAALGIKDFFGERIHGAVDDYKTFSKAIVLQRIVSESGLSGSQMVGFGDGFVEIEEIKKVGGVAVGLASHEDGKRGVNDWKRERLIDAGADLIIADYDCLDELLQMLRVD